MRKKEPLYHGMFGRSQPADVHVGKLLCIKRVGEMTKGVFNFAMELCFGPHLASTWCSGNLVLFL